MSTPSSHRGGSVYRLGYAIRSRTVPTLRKYHSRFECLTDSVFDSHLFVPAFDHIVDKLRIDNGDGFVNGKDDIAGPNGDPFDLDRNAVFAQAHPTKRFHVAMAFAPDRKSVWFDHARISGCPIDQRTCCTLLLCDCAQQFAPHSGLRLRGCPDDEIAWIDRIEKLQGQRVPGILRSLLSVSDLDILGGVCGADDRLATPQGPKPFTSSWQCRCCYSVRGVSGNDLLQTLNLK